MHKSLAEIRRKQGVRFIDWAPASIQVAAARFALCLRRASVN